MKKALFLLISLFCFLFSSNEVFAEKVEKISIEGNQRTEESTILSFIDIKVGDEISDNEIDLAIESLYNTGLFSNINISENNGTLEIEVEENPIVSEVYFEGNKRIKTKELKREISLSPRTTFSKSLLQKDEKRILTLYKRNGRYNAEVKTRLVEKSQNRLAIVFEIKENDVSKIRKISFVGNEVYGDKTLRSKISSKEDRWYRFLSNDDIYDPDRILYDKELLRRFYFSKGYADFKVLNHTVDLEDNKKDFVINFTIEEGEKYTLGKVNVEAKLFKLEEEEFLKVLETKPGKTFNAEKINSSIDSLVSLLGEKGFAFVNVKANYKKNSSENTIDLTYEIKEGPKFYVNQVNIKGNSRTIDKIVRRQIQLKEGEAFNSQKLKSSKRNINNLGFFGKSEISTKRVANSPDRLDVNVDVEEKSTGSLTFGAGFSTQDGALGEFSIVERNLFGRGQYLKLRLSASQLNQQIDLGFTEPYFMDQDVRAGFDVFTIKRDNSSDRSDRTFSQETAGFNLRAAYNITDEIEHSVRYSLRTDDISDVESDASTFIKRQEGSNTTSAIINTLIYDTRDNRFKPTEGNFIRYDISVAGLGGDAKYIKNEIQASHYQPIIGKDLILKIGVAGGHVFGIAGEDVRINDRFFLSERDIRGFRNDGIGPRDENSLDPLGGNTYFTGTTELQFPLDFIGEELGFTGSIFADAGTLFDTDDDITFGEGILDENSIRASVGVGLGWSSPVGPIQINFAESLAEEEFDRTRSISFSFGTNF